MEILYRCKKCNDIAPDNWVSMVCPCGGDLKGEGFPAISGTRDQFGIGNSFTDERTGKTIDNWKKWERAGYKNPMETTKNHRVKEMIKEKRAAFKGQHLRQPQPEEMPL